MSAEASDLSKVDSHNEDRQPATAEEVKKGHRRASSMAADVYNILDLGECEHLCAPMALVSRR